MVEKIITSIILISLGLCFSIFSKTLPRKIVKEFAPKIIDFYDKIYQKVLPKSELEGSEKSSKLLKDFCKLFDKPLIYKIATITWLLLGIVLIFSGMINLFSIFFK